MERRYEERAWEQLKNREKEAMPTTIAAISTPPGVGAIALVRVSGPEARAIGRLLVRERERFDRLPPRRNALFTLVDGDGEALDRALVAWYQAPASFTGEQLLELQCHGGQAVPAAVLRAALSAGAIPARAGEFTRRAFLNGKLDLAQAEAVDSLIQARNDQARRIAFSGLSGELGQEVSRLRERLLELKSELEYALDFPEEEQRPELRERLEQGRTQALESLERLLATAERDLLLGRGVLAVIAGAPNVGKSSLFNCLLGQERAIVAARPGTTRDAIEVERVFGGVLFRLVDTAGLRRTRDRVEQSGVEFSRKFLERADLVIFLHEPGREWTAPEQDFLHRLEGQRVLRVLSKSDRCHGSSGIPEGFLPVSAKLGTGLEELQQAMVRVVLGNGDQPAGPRVVSPRQQQLLESARQSLAEMDPSTSRGPAGSGPGRGAGAVGGTDRPDHR